MTSAGIRYSNIEPDHERRADPMPTGVKGRPSWNQCATGTSPLAMAMKLASRASEARQIGRATRGEAVEHFRRALEIKPGYAEARNNCGLAPAQQGKLAEASDH